MNLLRTRQYQQDNESVWGNSSSHFFRSTFVTSIMAVIRRHDLTKCLSVNELLLQMSRIYMVRYMDRSTGFLEILKRMNDLYKNLELEILTKHQ